MDINNEVNTFCSFYQVSRETIASLKKYENELIEANKVLNLIGNSTINQIWTRHFLDSVQVIDFVDKTCVFTGFLNICIDFVNKTCVLTG